MMCYDIQTHQQQTWQGLPKKCVYKCALSCLIHRVQSRVRKSRWAQWFSPTFRCKSSPQSGWRATTGKGWPHSGMKKIRNFIEDKNSSNDALWHQNTSTVDLASITKKMCVYLQVQSTFSRVSGSSSRLRTELALKDWKEQLCSP